MARIIECFHCGKEFLLTRWGFCDDCKKMSVHTWVGVVNVDREDYDCTVTVGKHEITEMLDHYEDKKILIAITVLE